eukprot:TRINITY_DN5300_c0_g1_i12.p1 TRINITY_DN5300_c0_g1~~TRINITY_DN5300_c0_g1_i12.p1  ORF type:complete len:735 (+),score=119.26 TRINITY_DN5300_c0_g1_i12:70-2274(+)
MQALSSPRHGRLKHVSEANLKSKRVLVHHNTQGQHQDLAAIGSALSVVPASLQQEDVFAPVAPKKPPPLGRKLYRAASQPFTKMVDALPSDNMHVHTPSPRMQTPRTQRPSESQSMVDILSVEKLAECQLPDVIKNFHQWYGSTEDVSYPMQDQLDDVSFQLNQLYHSNSLEEIDQIEKPLFMRLEVPDMNRTIFCHPVAQEIIQQLISANPSNYLLEKKLLISLRILACCCGHSIQKLEPGLSNSQTYSSRTKNRKYETMLERPEADVFLQNNIHFARKSIMQIHESTRNLIFGTSKRSSFEALDLLARLLWSCTVVGGDCMAYSAILQGGTDVTVHISLCSFETSRYLLESHLVFISTSCQKTAALLMIPLPNRAHICEKLQLSALSPILASPVIISPDFYASFRQFGSNASSLLSYDGNTWAICSALYAFSCRQEMILTDGAQLTNTVELETVLRSLIDHPECTVCLSEILIALYSPLSQTSFSITTDLSTKEFIALLVSTLQPFRSLVHRLAFRCITHYMMFIGHRDVRFIKIVSELMGNLGVSGAMSIRSKEDDSQFSTNQVARCIHHWMLVGRRFDMRSLISSFDSALEKWSPTACFLLEDGAAFRWWMNCYVEALNLYINTVRTVTSSSESRKAVEASIPLVIDDITTTIGCSPNCEDANFLRNACWMLSQGANTLGIESPAIRWYSSGVSQSPRKPTAPPTTDFLNQPPIKSPLHRRVLPTPAKSD